MTTIISTRKLEESEIESIMKKFDIKDSKSIKFEIDTTLVGGVIVKKDGEMFDGSVKGQLEKLKEKLYTRVI